MGLFGKTERHVEADYDAGKITVFESKAINFTSMSYQSEGGEPIDMGPCEMIEMRKIVEATIADPIDR